MTSHFGQITLLHAAEENGTCNGNTTNYSVISKLLKVDI